MPQYFDEDRQAIRDRLRRLFDSATDEQGQPLFPDQDTPGTPGYTLRETFMRLMRQHLQQANTIMEDFSPRTAKGAGLDAWANYFGMSRGASSTASGEAVISSDVTGETLERLDGSRRVPEGTRLVGASQALETTETVEVAEQESSVRVGVQATRASTGRVADVGATYDIQNRQLLSAEIVSAVDGGTSTETDQQLRFRLSRAMRAPSTFEGLRAKMLSNKDVDDVRIEEAAYGPGTAEVFVSPAVDFPSEDLRQELEAEAAEGPGQVYVIFPDYEGVSLRIQITGPAPGGAKEAVASLVANIEPGEPLLVNDVEQVVRENGAQDAQVIGMRRGAVGEDKSFIQPRTLKQVTNLRPKDAKTRWFTKPGWITLC